MGQKLEDRDLYLAQKGRAPRDGGPYLDDEERERHEIRRAKAEGREPDLKNPPPTVGDQLVTYDLLDDGHASRPSQRELLDTPTRRQELKPEVVQTVQVPAVTVADQDPTHSSHGVDKAADESKASKSTAASGDKSNK